MLVAEGMGEAVTVRVGGWVAVLVGEGVWLGEGAAVAVLVAIRVTIRAGNSVMVAAGVAGLQAAHIKSRSALQIERMIFIQDPGLLIVPRLGVHQFEDSTVICIPKILIIGIFWQ